MPTIREVINQASYSIDKLDARLLLCFCLNKPITYLIAHDRDPLDSQILEQYQTLVNRRKNGEPFPYIVGSQDFYARSFHVNPNVLIPRPDTETLIDEVLRELSSHPAHRLLDLGTGSGCIAITLAKECLGLEITATDFSDKALDVARLNAKRYNANILFALGCWYDAIAPEARFDIIVSNPPYIEKNDPHLSELTYEPLSALTDHSNGLSDLKQIIAGAPDHLYKNGLLILEHGWDQGRQVRALFDTDLWDCPITIKDLGGNDRVTKARLKPTDSYR